MQFRNVIAQDSLKKELIQSANSEKVSQALLFVGSDGTGTLPMALAFSQFLNCENRQEEDSCGECNSCKKISKMIHPDIFYTYPTIKAKTLSKDFIKEWREACLENPYLNVIDWMTFLDNENKQGNITASECEQIIRQHSLKHYEGKYKIQIIWMAEFLKKEGNKLLKLLEEPPENTIFMLIAEKIEDILVTILSRTQVIKFNKLNEKIIQENLVEKLQIDSESSRKIAQIVDGNWNHALKISLSNKETSFTELEEWFNILLVRDKGLEEIEKLVSWTEKMGTIGRENQKLFLKRVLFFLRECLIFKTGLRLKLNEEEKDLAKSLIKRVSLEEIANVSTLINDLHYETMRNANFKIGLMNVSLEIEQYLNTK